jgi:type IV pilus assembly protein PilP
MNWSITPNVIFCLFAVSACNLSSDDETTSWIEKQTRQTALTVVAFPAISKFQAQQFSSSSEVDPFDEQRLVLAHKKEWLMSVAQGGALGAEMRRKKEALEDFPLESMTMVGRVNDKSQQVALVKVDAVLYQVRLGSHLGPNFGRVIDINDRGLSLRELVQDPAGKWTERMATLALQEKMK